MGYRGKVVEQERARELRALAWTLAEIARELGVSRASVSVWVRDVGFEPRPRQRPVFRNPSSLHLARLAEIDESRRRVREYLHEVLDMEAARRFCSDTTGVPLEQFRQEHRPPADPTIRRNWHEHGCCHVRDSCATTH